MGASPKARASRERERGSRAKGASPKARASLERGFTAWARAQSPSHSRKRGSRSGASPVVEHLERVGPRARARAWACDPARVGKGNTGIAGGGGGLDAKCRVLTETAGGPSLACGRLVPWRPVVTGPPSVEAHKPTVRAPSSRGCGWFTSARSLSLSIPRRRGREPRARGSQEGLHAWGKP